MGSDLVLLPFARANRHRASESVEEAVHILKKKR